MTAFPGLVVEDPDGQPPVYVVIFATADIRNEAYGPINELAPTQKIEVDLAGLSDLELNGARLLVEMVHPNFVAMSAEYVEEKIRRFKRIVEADVEAALSHNSPIAATDLVWSVTFRVAGAVFAIGITSGGSVVPSIGGNGKINNEADLDLLVKRVALKVLQATSPILQRLTPTPAEVVQNDAS